MSETVATIILIVFLVGAALALGAVIYIGRIGKPTEKSKPKEG